MFSIFIFGALLAAVVFILTNMNGELIIRVNSKYGISLGSNSDVSKAYVAKRKKDKSGDNVNHWKYYNDSGETIKDETLSNLIFDSFKYEDWYGEYAFYINDKDFYLNTTSIEEVIKEEEIVNSIEEMEDLIHGTPV